MPFCFQHIRKTTRPEIVRFVKNDIFFRPSSKEPLRFQAHFVFPGVPRSRKTIIGMHDSKSPTPPYSGFGSGSGSGSGLDRFTRQITPCSIFACNEERYRCTIRGRIVESPDDVRIIHLHIHTCQIHADPQALFRSLLPRFQWTENDRVFPPAFDVFFFP